MVRATLVLMFTGCFTTSSNMKESGISTNLQGGEETKKRGRRGCSRRTGKYTRDGGRKKKLQGEEISADEEQGWKDR